MESTRFAAWLFVAATVWFTARSEAWEFYVGGKDGWVQNPSESYNHWAERNRFRVNDTLFFRYEKGKDSVLVVTKDDYDSCDTSSPLLALTDGASRFKFDRSGPFFFISGIADRCNAGQKLIVVVLAVRNTPGGGGGPTPSPAPPAAQPPVPPPPQPDSPGGTSPSDGGAPAPAPSRSSASKAGFPCGGGVGLVIALGVGFAHWWLNKFGFGFGFGFGLA